MSRYAKLNYVKDTATGTGLNNEVTIEENPDGKTATVTEGRVGVLIRSRFNKARTYTIPIGQWDMFIGQKKLQGYMITATQKLDAIVVKKSNGVESIEDENVREIVEALLSYTAQAMNEMYTVKVENISKEMLDIGKEIITNLSLNYKNMSPAAFNTELKRLFTVIPRRIDNLSKMLAMDKSKFVEVLEREQENFNFTYDAVNQSLHEVKGNFLEDYGLEWRPVSKEEEAEIKKLMKGNADKYHRAWRITNKNTEKRFNELCEKEGLTLENHGIEKLFHGSKHEHWWSIITNGLVIDPEKFGAAICGKAYGYGTYFAPDAVKSFGYTSIRGSKWAHGSSKCGYMGIYKVATGDEQRQYRKFHGTNSSLNFAVLQKMQPNALCTWAEARYSGFMMDEVIVYRDCQDTIEYLIEVE